MIAILLDEEEEEKIVSREPRKFWVHAAWKKRETEGEFATLYIELIHDEIKFYEYFRMSMYISMYCLKKLKMIFKNKTPTLGYVFHLGID